MTLCRRNFGRDDTPCRRNQVGTRLAERVDPAIVQQLVEQDLLAETDLPLERLFALPKMYEAGFLEELFGDRLLQELLTPEFLRDSLQPVLRMSDSVLQLQPSASRLLLDDYLARGWVPRQARGLAKLRLKPSSRRSPVATSGSPVGPASEPLAATGLLRTPELDSSVTVLTLVDD